MLRVAFGLVLLSSLAHAQVGELRSWTPPAGETRLTPKRSCASLRALTGYEFSVISATSEGGMCRVLGQIQPEIQFEVALPASWHRRLLMIGNGGYAGEPLEAPGRIAVRDAAVEHGWMFTHTNTGHDAQREPLGSFAVDSQKLLDYAFRAVHVTALTAKKIAQAYYGSGPTRSYFVGCSTGGRQALISAQRFPEDFDGILAGAPVLNFVSTVANHGKLAQVFAEAPVPAAKFKLIADASYAKCDVIDGVKDGIIDDPRQCAFIPSKDLPRCTGSDAPDCFTEAQLRSLDTLYSEQKIGSERTYPTWLPGAEAIGPNGRPGWYGWLMRDDGVPLFHAFSETFFRYFVSPVKRPNLQLKDMNLESEWPKLSWIRTTLNATDPDLSAFRDRGGKLLMWFGWADPALNPLMGVEYYQAAEKQMGAGARDFFRLFMMPGVFHCGGGPGCDSAPRLGALIDWVERGVAPARITASKFDGTKLVRTRPLCVFPQVARYNGSGSTDEAANFTCADPVR